MQVRLTHGTCGASLPARTHRHRHATLSGPPAPLERPNPWLPVLHSPPCGRQCSTRDGGRSTASAGRSGSCLAASRPLAAAFAVDEPPAAPLSLAPGSIAAGPTTPKPSYEAIDSQPQNRLFMHLFRGKLAEGLGEDASEPGCASMRLRRECPEQRCYSSSA